LATILSPDVGSASSDLSKAEADATTAEHDMYRQRELVAEGAASRRDAEQAEDHYRRAAAELERARERVRLLHGGSFNRVTQQFALRAPIAGEVITRNANPGIELAGQYTTGGGGNPGGGAAGSGAELFTIGELDHVWVLAEVYEVDLARVLVGATATVTV